MMQRSVIVLLLWMWVGVGTVNGVRAEEMRTAAAEPAAEDMREAIVQIFGQRCEYHRRDVEGALRRFDTVAAVKFLNNHGTVLVTYRPGSATPVQFADEIERELAMGWGCKAKAQ
jgi:hypothetical protein